MKPNAVQLDKQRAKPRVSLVLAPEEREIAERLAAERGLSLSALVGQLLRAEEKKTRGAK